MAAWGITRNLFGMMCSYMVSFSSQVLLSDLHLLSGQTLFRTSMRCFLLFFSLFLNGFFEDLCFLDALLRVLRNPDGNGRAEPLHYIAELHPSCYLYECCFSQLIILTIIFHHFSVQPIAYFYRSCRPLVYRRIREGKRIFRFYVR